MAKGKNRKKLERILENKAPTPLTFNKLLKDGTIANYRSCVVETLYAHQANSSVIIVLFSRIKFYDEVQKESRNTTQFDYYFEDKNDVKYKTGLFRQVKNASFGTMMYSSLQSNTWPEKFDFEVRFGELTEQSPIYIKADSRYVKEKDKMPLSTLLGIVSGYDSIENGAYIIEFEDLKKDFQSFIFEEMPLSKLGDLQNELKEESNLNLANFPDKIGNIIFEFPVNNIRLTRLSTDCQIKVDLLRSLKPKAYIELIFEYRSDDNMSRKYVQKYPRNHIISFADNTKPYKVTIYDRVRGMVLAECNNCEYERPNAGTSTGFAIHNRPMRKITLNEIIYETTPTFSFPLPKDLHSSDWLNLRKKELAIQQSSKNLQSKEYSNILTGADSEAEHQLAIDDLKSLLKKYGRYGVYLIDPYITPDDILKTLYFSQYGNTEMKVIGSADAVKDFFVQKAKEIESTDEEIEAAIELAKTNWKDKADRHFKEKSNNFGINLEYRVGYHVPNFHLHDRFIIFPYNFQEKRPLAWSLGTSINSVGKSFHILTKLENGKLILDIFKALWDKIQEDDCLVFKQ